ncbi:MAG: hypothetical protein Q8M03_04580 [Legionella sp.]|nr:hypothetical protein [Legionella sp.]
MVINGESILRLVDFLHNKLSKENPPNLSKCISQFKYIKEQEYKYLFTVIDEVLKGTASNPVTFFGAQLSLALNERKNLDIALRECIFQMSNFLAVLHNSVLIYNEGIKDSVVHACLVCLVMLQLQFTIAPVFEVVHASLDTGKHAFVLFNRNRNFLLEDVHMWGNDCYIIDSYHQWFGDWDDTSGSASRYPCKDKIISGAKLNILFTNDFNLNSLFQFSHDGLHYLHRYEQSARQRLQDYFSDHLTYFTQIFSLPALSILDDLPEDQEDVLDSVDLGTQNFTL